MHTRFTKKLVECGYDPNLIKEAVKTAIQSNGSVLSGRPSLDGGCETGTCSKCSGGCGKGPNG